MQKNYKLVDKALKVFGLLLIFPIIFKILNILKIDWFYALLPILIVSSLLLLIILSVIIWVLFLALSNLNKEVTA